MVQVAQMVERHLEGILAHWKEGLTTAFMEGLNSLFSATKRKARGYGRFQTIRTVIFMIAGKLNFSSFNTHLQPT
jgi:transposase